MKKYSIHLEGGAKVTLECTTPRTGGLNHDLVCKNESGDTIAYFYTFLYWEETPPDSRRPVGVCS